MNELYGGIHSGGNLTTSAVDMPKTGVSMQWTLRGLHRTTGQWVNIETYPNELAAEIAFTSVRVRSRFSDKVHIRDFDDFSVFAIEPMFTVTYRR